MAKLSIEGFKPSEGGVRAVLPANAAYVCKILGAKVENMSWGDVLVLQVEITEGEYDGFFKKDYEAQQGGQYEAKYRGVFRIRIPSKSSEHYDWDLAAFNRAFGAIEASNEGYRFADTMETNTLKNKLVGILTRESEFNDKVFTEIGMLLSVDRARSGNFKPMKRRGGSGSTAAANTAPVATSAFAETDDDDDLPF